ncbi:MAG: HAD-IIB family hydrolase [Ruminococcaceae bacterium]|nr:HAD-IIB family hydrolase [Oscillospiraceae bacterium]
MGKFDGIAILTDLDGTFLGKGGRMVERNREAIERFKAEGGLFTLATGRMHFGLEKWVPGLYTLVNAPAFLCNGTYLYDFGESRVLSEIVMDGDLAYEAIAFVRRNFPSASLRVSFRGGYLMDEKDVKAVSQIVDYGIDEKIIEPFAIWSREGWYKVVCTDDATLIPRIREAIETQFPNRFEFNCSSAHLLEMQMKGVNKASMLAPFRAYYRERGKALTVYSCGDFENDFEILRAADVAVCPSNAMQRIKDICKLCFCSNDEGVIADLVEYLEKARA